MNAGLARQEGARIVQQRTRIFLVSFFLAGGGLLARDYPTGVEFHQDSVSRKGVRGDNWCQTWASDGNIYTMMDDGNGWWRGPQSGSLCLQIWGNEDFGPSDVKRMPGWPRNAFNSSFYA